VAAQWPKVYQREYFCGEKAVVCCGGKLPSAPFGLAFSEHLFYNDYTSVMAKSQEVTSKFAANTSKKLVILVASDV
jgi:hypothetical protein